MGRGVCEAGRARAGERTPVCGAAGAIEPGYVLECCVHGRRCSGGNVIVILHEIATRLQRNSVGEMRDSRLLESRSEMQGASQGCSHLISLTACGDAYRGTASCNPNAARGQCQSLQTDWWNPERATADSRRVEEVRGRSLIPSAIWLQTCCEKVSILRSEDHSRADHTAEASKAAA